IPAIRGDEAKRPVRRQERIAPAGGDRQHRQAPATLACATARQALSACSLPPAIRVFTMARCAKIAHREVNR
ncbi:hypothetical protein, partial [Salmonella enterica]|uniref:hypothetical protein n=1 Tax=Salmonella enterica TaxID=28901 RepID=UPI003CE748BE